MIFPNLFPTYAQYNEDIILLALLWDVEVGFYIDVGANYPVVDSVTKLFYDRSWSGINIEPIESIYKQLKRQRPRDINLHLGIGDKNGELDFFENTVNPGHSHFQVNGDDRTNTVLRRVPVKTLKQVCIDNKVSRIDFLKIDVEGFEAKVIAGNDWSIYRPQVVCIEANHKSVQWQNDIIDKGYKLFILDGLNEYYVSDESWHRTDGFADRAIMLSRSSLYYDKFRSWKSDSQQLKKLTRLNQTHYDLLQETRKDNEDLLRKMGRVHVGISKIRNIVTKRNNKHG